MKNLVSKLLLLPLLLATVMPASATLTLRMSADNGATWTTVSDINVAPDLSPVTGIVTFSGLVGSWTVLLSTGVSKPALGSAAAPAFDIHEVDVSTTNGSTLIIELSETGFTPAPGAAQTFYTSIGGNTVGTVTFTTWADSSDILFQQTTPISTLGPFNTAPFGGSITVPAPSLGAPYSLTLRAVVQHPIRGRTGFDGMFRLTCCTPTISCPPPKQLQCGESTAPSNTGTPTAQSPCGSPLTVTYSDQVTPGSCPANYTITRTWTATDNCDNSVSCVQIITVADSQPPTINCPPDITVDCLASKDPADTGRATGSDNCGGVTITYSDSIVPKGCPGRYAILRYWKATDDCQLSSSCTQTITVEDTHPPVITGCPTGPILLPCNSTPRTCADALLLVTASDDCSGPITPTCSGGSVVANGCQRTQTFVLTATDGCNSSQCEVTYTWTEDTEAPTFRGCPPGPIPLQCNSITPTCDDALDLVGAEDNCNGFIIPQCQAGPVVEVSECQRTRTFILTATDACNNSSQCQLTFAWTVDTTPPVFNGCPTEPVQLSCNPTLPTCDDARSYVTVFDTCSGAILPDCETGPIEEVSPCQRQQTFTLTAMDNCGNSSQCQVTFAWTADTTAPSFVGCPPGPIELPCNPVLPTCADALGQIAASDGCSGRVIPVCEAGPIVEVNACRRSQTFTIRASDSCNNSAQCQVVYTWTEDRVPPVFVGCPTGPIALPCNATPRTCNDVLALVQATDNCAGPITPACSGGSVVANGCQRTQTFLLRASDGCGNSSECQVTYTWTVDTDPPVFTGCPNGPIALPCNSNPTCADAVALVSVSDNCSGPLTPVCEAGPIQVNNCQRSQTFTLTARDNCNNSARCQVTYNWTVDTTPPSITCAGDMTIECPAAPIFPDPTVSDTCGSATLAILTTTTNAGPDGSTIITRTWEATDACGNKATCSQRITVLPCHPAGCRVTGGSNRQTNSWQSACITTPLPSHISHGGQVGAPFSGETPFTPNSPCISGEWQHNRHTKNGNSLVGNFHAAGNGNVRQFDSLLCACLPCDENPNTVGVVGEVCNPGDRICGPEPRRAPANKICFSGVGDYTFTNGKKTVKAVFRVDIEDRSEGNSQASTPPPDRYRIRIWLLDPSCGRNPDPTSAEAMAIRYAASADPSKIATLATTEDLKVNIPPDIDDGGNMTQGNHQIHPATGAECSAPVTASATVDVAARVASLTNPDSSDFATTAYAYDAPVAPTFAHRVTITNSGPVALTNLSVTQTKNTVVEDATALYFPAGATLAPGAIIAVSYTNAVTEDTVHTIVITGNSSRDGKPLIAASTAVASVRAGDTTPPTLTCPANISVTAPAGRCSAVVTYPLPQATDDFPAPVALSCTPPSGAAFAKGITTVTCTGIDGWNNRAICSFTVTVGLSSFGISAPSPLPALETSLNVLSGPAGFAAYSWSLTATGTGWAITTGAATASPVYSAGSGTATFKLIATTSEGCKSTNQVTFGCIDTANSAGPAFWGGKTGINLTTTVDFSWLTTANLRDASGSNADFKSNINKNRSDFESWMKNRSPANMSYHLSAQLAAMALNVLHGAVAGTKVVPIAGCGNLNNGNSITINDLLTLANKALYADGNTPASDPNRAIQECYKNALATANAEIIHP